MDEVTIQLDWSGARDVVAQPANMVLVQGLRGEFILSFGHAPPPIAMATLDEAETIEFVKNNAIKVQQITRVTLHPHIAKVLVQNLGNLLRAEDGEAASAAGEAEGVS